MLVTVIFNLPVTDIARNIQNDVRNLKEKFSLLYCLINTSVRDKKGNSLNIFYNLNEI
jgi:hypothetical protein